MASEIPAYDPRYLAGILLFNAGDYFEAHEVWEDLWAENAGRDRSFYQGLIQAAVALCHFGNGNLRGARKLYESSEGYMRPCRPVHRGLDVTRFWEQMRVCFAEILTGPAPPTTGHLKDELVPKLTLDPQPAEWPDVAAFVHDV